MKWLVGTLATVVALVVCDAHVMDASFVRLANRDAVASHREELRHEEHQRQKRSVENQVFEEGRAELKRLAEEEKLESKAAQHRTPEKTKELQKQKQAEKTRAEKKMQEELRRMEKKLLLKSKDGINVELKSFDKNAVNLEKLANNHHKVSKSKEKRSVHNKQMKEKSLMLEAKRKDGTLLKHAQPYMKEGRTLEEKKTIKELRRRMKREAQQEKFPSVQTKGLLLKRNMKLKPKFSEEDADYWSGEHYAKAAFADDLPDDLPLEFNEVVHHLQEGPNYAAEELDGAQSGGMGSSGAPAAPYTLPDAAADELDEYNEVLLDADHEVEDYYKPVSDYAAEELDGAQSGGMGSSGAPAAPYTLPDTAADELDEYNEVLLDADHEVEDYYMPVSVEQYTTPDVSGNEIIPATPTSRPLYLTTTTTDHPVTSTMSTNASSSISSEATEGPTGPWPWEIQNPDLEPCGKANFGSSRRATKILQGKEALPGSFPWQAAILDEDRDLLCGGTLIAPRWVMTAAHCVRKKMHVRLSEHHIKDKDGLEVEQKVRRIFRHPAYNSSTIDNDLALLRLPALPSYPARSGGHPTRGVTDRACLPLDGEDFPRVGTRCLVMGWGKSSMSNSYGTDVLMYTRLPIISHKACQRSNRKTITEHMFCAGHYKGGSDTCSGDSGGPLLCVNGPPGAEESWTVYGVTSWGDGCGVAGKIGVYAKVNKYLDWIAGIMSRY